jgi:hypothetical protein
LLSPGSVNEDIFSYLNISTARKAYKTGPEARQIQWIAYADKMEDVHRHNIQGRVVSKVDNERCIHHIAEAGDMEGRGKSAYRINQVGKATLTRKNAYASIPTYQIRVNDINRM